MNKPAVIAGVALVVGIVAAVVWRTGEDDLSRALRGLSGGDAAGLAAKAVVSRCELPATERAVFRETLNEALPPDYCEVATCPGDPPAACPRGTVLAETGEPAEADIDGEVAVEQLKAEVKAQVREEVRQEVEADVAAEVAAEVAGNARANP